jgi:hypothetical protein
MPPGVLRPGPHDARAEGRRSELDHEILRPSRHAARRNRAASRRESPTLELDERRVRRIRRDAAQEPDRWHVRADARAFAARQCPGAVQLADQGLEPARDLEPQGLDVGAEAKAAGHDLLFGTIAPNGEAALQDETEVRARMHGLERQPIATHLDMIQAKRPAACMGARDALGYPGRHSLQSSPDRSDTGETLKGPYSV